MFWTQTNWRWTDIGRNEIPREKNLNMGWRRKRASLLDLLELLVGKCPWRAKKRLKSTQAALSSAFLPRALLSHLPLSFSFLESPEKGSGAAAAPALSPVGEKSLCEVQLQAASIWFCQLVWHAMKNWGSELQRKLRTRHSYLEVLCLEMRMEGTRAESRYIFLENSKGRWRLNSELRGQTQGRAERGEVREEAFLGKKKKTIDEQCQGGQI